MMTAACWLGLTYVLSIEHSKIVSGATQQADNLAPLFEESIVSTFKGIDRSMLLLRQAYERDPAHFDLREWTQRTAIVGDLTLQLSVVGADGFTMGATQLGPDKAFKNAARPISRRLSPTLLDCLDVQTSLIVSYDSLESIRWRAHQELSETQLFATCSLLARRRR
jgi:hypothetical protein